MANNTLEQLSWSTILFKPGRPLLESELNLIQELAEYKRKGILGFQTTHGFLRKNQFEDALSDYTYGLVLKLKAGYFLFKGELFKIPELTFPSPASNLSLIYLKFKEVEVGIDPTVVQPPFTDVRVPEYGFSGGPTIQSGVYQSAVGTPTASRKSFNYSLETTSYNFSYFNGITGYTLVDGVLTSTVAGETFYAIPLCLVSGRPSPSFSFSDVTGIANHPEGKVTGAVYKEDVLDLRQHIYLSHFSFEGELNRQKGLLFQNSLKTWAVSTADMGLPSGHVLTAGETSTTPLVIQDLVGGTDTFKTRYADIPYSFQIFASDVASLPTSGPIRKSSSALIYDSAVYNLDFLSGITNTVTAGPNAGEKTITLTTGYVIFSLLTQADFKYKKTDERLYLPNLTAVSMESATSSYEIKIGSQEKKILYRARAPQAIGSGIAQALFDLQVTVSPVYTPDTLYACSVSRHSRNQATPYNAPSEQIPLPGKLDSEFLNRSGQMIGSSFATDEGFVSLPILKKFGLAQEYTFIRNNTPKGGIDSARRSYLDKGTLSQQVFLQGEGLTIPTNRKLFYPFLARINSSNKNVLSVGDLVLVVFSSSRDATDNFNMLDSTDSNFTVSMFKPQNLWKLL
jgi:hypothetical protein